MRYYMVTFRGCYSDNSTTSQTVWINQNSDYFDADSFRAIIHDEFSEGDENFSIVILFMRDCKQIEFEVNKYEQKGQSQ